MEPAAFASATEPPSQQQQSSGPFDNADQKILADLDVVIQKMDLCQSFLRPDGTSSTTTPAVVIYKSNSACLEVMGFLEACAPRMVELVEAAAQGAVSETVFEKCLLVNDRLTTVLADVDAVEFTEEEPPAVTTTTTTEDDFDAFLTERSERSTPLG